MVTRNNSSAHFPLQVYIDQLAALFKQAQRSRHPALFLYRHDARTPLFMAESLARLLWRIAPDEHLEHALKTFKKLEDALGRVDDNDALAREFSKIKSIKEEELDYFTGRRDKELEKLDKKLADKAFYLETFINLRRELDINFDDPKLVTQLHKEMQAGLTSAFEFFKRFAGRFSDMEEQVHELRRKLRWISIYGQSLQGIMYLQPGSKHQVWEKQFITRRERESPYNKLPSHAHFKKRIAVNAPAFYATSYVIEELGLIKDKGLAIEAFAKMLKKTGAEKGGKKQAMKRLNATHTVEELMQEAHALLQQYFVTYHIYRQLL